MSYSIQQIENHLIGMGHGSTLKKVRNRYASYERSMNTMLAKIDPLPTMRLQPVSRAIHDDVYNYALPTDFKDIVDLMPQDDRNLLDDAKRRFSRPFDLKKEMTNKVISIEGQGGDKILRVNWRSTSPKTVANLNAVGDWTVVGSATTPTADTLYKKSGSASLQFDLVATGDGLSNTELTEVDLEDWDEQAEFFMWIFMNDVSNLTSIQGIWGNDITTAYWTSVAQTTQADGTAFRNGWNLIKFPWVTATETGTVDPETIDSFKFVIAATGAINNIRVDNITVSLGRLFDVKYWSSYGFQTSAGTWIKQPTGPTDVVMVSETELNIYLYECLISMAQQMEGEDSSFDISFAQNELGVLYPLWRSKNPQQAKKVVGTYSSLPRVRRT